MLGKFRLAPGDDPAHEADLVLIVARLPDGRLLECKRWPDGSATAVVEPTGLGEGDRLAALALAILSRAGLLPATPAGEVALRAEFRREFLHHLASQPE